LITQRVFVAETYVWVRCKFILLSKNQIIKKPTTIFSKKFFGLDDFGITLKKLPMNNICMMYVCSFLVVCGACLNFFKLIFKDGPLKNSDRFLTIDPPESTI
jgi:hypothetical protein